MSFKRLSSHTYLNFKRTEKRFKFKVQLGAWIGSMLDNPAIVKEKGLFYIDKKTKTRTFSKPKGKHREIRFLKDKFTRDLLGQINSKIDISSEHLHGFRKRRSIHSFKTDYLSQNRKALMLVDLENAFNQIPQQWVYLVWRRVFHLHKKKALLATELCCHNGFLYQGCPLSPMLFNLFSANAIEDINKIGNGFVAIAYADDIVILNKERKYISWKSYKYLIKILSQAGLKVNLRKTLLASNSRCLRYLGLRMEEKKIGNRNKVKHKVFCLKKKVSTETFPAKAIADGYEAWLKSGPITVRL